MVSVTCCAALTEFSAWLEKLRLVGETLARITPPVPLKLMDCGLPDALSAMFKPPEAAPRATGEKETLIVQLDPAASAEGQLFDWENGPLIA